MPTFQGFKTALDTGKYVGTPYSQNGCFKLLRDVYLDCLGVDLGEGNLFVVEGSWGSAVAEAKADWVPVNSPEPFDAVLMLAHRGAEAPTHIGIYVGDGKVMHTRQKTGCIIEKVVTLQRAGVVEGLYRHRRVLDARLGCEAQD